MTMPAPTGVSGPGALSQRTDLQPMSVPTGMPYGQAGALAQAEQAAPMPQDPASQASTAQAASFVQAAAQSGPPVSAPPTLDQGSQRPGEPVTHGADAGPGAGSSILSTPPGVPAGGQISQTIAKAAASDPTGLLARLGAIAQQRGL
jgi:hypothetical protein